MQFLSISGSDFVEMYVGVGASRVRDLFEQAKKSAPAIVFIDEIDAVGRQRGSGLGGGHDEREQTLNQLLVEMDGFAANEGVVVLAATNRVDILDPALLRPGRFDRQVYVGLPDIKGREEISAGPRQEQAPGGGRGSGQSRPGHRGLHRRRSGEPAQRGGAAGRAAGQAFITMEDLQESVIKVIAGPEKHSRVVPEAERRLTAYHEAGHAVVMHALPDLDPVHQITIVPRGQAGGMTIYLPEEDRSYLSRSYMLDQIAGLLGGRAAEELMLGDISTGASNDIQRATPWPGRWWAPTACPTSWAAWPSTPGTTRCSSASPWRRPAPTPRRRRRRWTRRSAPSSTRPTPACREILARYRSQLAAVAEYLLENETMDAETFEAVFRQIEAKTAKAAL